MLAVDAGLVDLSGKTCNKIGVSYEAFVNQHAKCRLPHARYAGIQNKSSILMCLFCLVCFESFSSESCISCLKNQPHDLMKSDLVCSASSELHLSEIDPLYQYSLLDLFLLWVPFCIFWFDSSPHFTCTISSVHLTNATVGSFKLFCKVHDALLL